MVGATAQTAATAAVSLALHREHGLLPMTVADVATVIVRHTPLLYGADVRPPPEWRVHDVINHIFTPPPPPSGNPRMAEDEAAFEYSGAGGLWLTPLVEAEGEEEEEDPSEAEDPPLRRCSPREEPPIDPRVLEEIRTGVPLHPELHIRFLWGNGLDRLPPVGFARFQQHFFIGEPQPQQPQQPQYFFIGQ